MSKLYLRQEQYASLVPFLCPEVIFLCEHVLLTSFFVISEDFTEP